MKYSCFHRFSIALDPQKIQRRLTGMLLALIADEDHLSENLSDRFLANGKNVDFRLL